MNFSALLVLLGTKEKFLTENYGVPLQTKPVGKHWLMIPQDQKAIAKKVGNHICLAHVATLYLDQDRRFVSALVMLNQRTTDTLPVLD